ncbi:MAG: TonB-dependent receptor [Pseudomonadota bacterium]
MKNSQRRGEIAIFTTALLGGSTLCATLQVHAQSPRPETSADGPALETVLVTAPRSEAVTLFDNLDLQKDRGTSGIEYALRRAPNINVLGTQNGFINIRGENAEGAGNSALGIIPGRLVPTPVTVDRRPLAYGEITFGTSSVYDLDYLEVVRGPQTTGGGINGAMGAVNVVTRDPGAEREAEILAEYGTFDQRQIAGFVSGPLIAGELFGRLSVDYNERDTYLNYTNPAARSPRQNLFFDQTTVRAKLVWSPDSMDDLRVETSYSFTDSAGPQTENVTDGPDTNFERNSSNVASFFNEAQSVYLDIDYTLSDNLAFNNHLTAATSDLARRSGNGSFRLDQETDDVQNEARFDYESEDGRFQFSPGIIARRQSVDMDWDYFGPTILDDERTSLGVYGEASYELFPGFRATAGLRYQYEAQERQGVLADDPMSNPTPIDYDESFDTVLPRLGISYDLSDTVSLGAFVAQGFTPGGFGFSRPPADGGRGDGETPFALPEFDEELRTTYEAFLRSLFLDGRLEVLVNVFFNDIDDIQLRESVEIGEGLFASIIVNAQEGQTYGLEIATSYSANSWLDLSGSLGLLETEITEFSQAPTIEGNELERAPGVTANFGIDVTPSDRLSLGASVSYTGGYFSAFNNLPLEETNARTLVDLRASYLVTDRVELYGVANNIFDETELTELFGGARFGSSIKPQEFVVGIRASF